MLEVARVGLFWPLLAYSGLTYDEILDTTKKN
jgi:hypothetical protein